MMKFQNIEMVLNESTASNVNCLVFKQLLRLNLMFDFDFSKSVLSFCCFLSCFQAIGQSTDTTKAAPQTAVPAALAPPIEVEVMDYEARFAVGQIELLASGVSGPAEVSLNGEKHSVVFQYGKAKLAFETGSGGGLVHLHTEASGHRLYYFSVQKKVPARTLRIPIWLCALPPVLAIGVAWHFKKKVVSIILGSMAGAYLAFVSTIL